MRATTRFTIRTHGSACARAGEAVITEISGNFITAGAVFFSSPEMAWKG